MPSLWKLNALVIYSLRYGAYDTEMGSKYLEVEKFRHRRTFSFLPFNDELHLGPDDNDTALELGTEVAFPRAGKSHCPSPHRKVQGKEGSFRSDRTCQG